MTMITYSVVICTLDRKEGLKQCIASWLEQKPLPYNIVVVHGRQDGALEDGLQKLLSGTGVELFYLRMPPSLVRQRNAGIEHAKGDVVFFADDDAVYLDGYAQTILDVYEADSGRLIGGVQGTVDNINVDMADRLGFKKLFLLTCFGNGSLQLSAWPAFCRPSGNLTQVEVFSGVAMSYRKEVLREFKFDEMLARYWIGDDFEMAYRVSRKYKLFQASCARLLHYSSPVGRDNQRLRCKMLVVNHFFLMRKIFGFTPKSGLYWCWSELGLWAAAGFCLIIGRGAARLFGMVDGCRELCGIISQSKTSDTKLSKL